MRTSNFLLLTLSGWLSLALAQDLLFPYMQGLNYSEHDKATKLGLTAHVCKDEAEWYSMTTADFAKYKAIIIPDPQCNTSLNTIKFLDETKRVWSPAVTGNIVLIGTDPSFHYKWYKLAGADAMMKDSIRLVSTNENGTGMYMSLSCYYQSTAAPVPIDALSEIGNFQVRGNLSRPCLNKAHLVAKHDVMTSLTDEMASNWNCSVHEAFTEFPNTGSRGFQALAIALNATGPGETSFGDGTSGIPYIIARGATPAGCGNNITETDYNEECDDGPANGTPGSLCSTSCRCIFGMIIPGVCRSNTTSSSTSPAQSSTPLASPSSVATNTSLGTNSSSTRGYTTVTAWPSSNRSHTNVTWTPPTGPVTITVFPPWPPGTDTSTPHPSTSRQVSNDSAVPIPIPPPKTVTVEPPVPSVSSTSLGSKPSGPRTITVLPPSVTETTETEPGTVTVTANPAAPQESGPKTITIQPPRPSFSPSSPESSAIGGNITVTASALPVGQSSDSSSTSSTGLSHSAYVGNTTVTGSRPPLTPTLPQSSFRQSSSGTSTSPGDATVTATGQPGTQPHSRSDAITSPGEPTVTMTGNPFSSHGDVTIATTGHSGSRASNDTVSTTRTSFSRGLGNFTSTSLAQSGPDTKPPTVIVTATPSNGPQTSSGTHSITLPITVTASPSGGLPGQPSSLTNTPGNPLTSPSLTESELPIGSSLGTGPGALVSSRQSKVFVSITGSKITSSTGKASSSQRTESDATETPFPGSLGTSSVEKTGTLPTSSRSYKPSQFVSKSFSSPYSVSATSSKSPGRQAGTSQSTVETQQPSQNPTHTGTSTDSLVLDTTRRTSGTLSATSSRQPVSRSIGSVSTYTSAQAPSGAASVEPSPRTRTSGKSPTATNDSGTPSNHKAPHTTTTNPPIGATTNVAPTDHSSQPDETLSAIRETNDLTKTRAPVNTLSSESRLGSSTSLPSYENPEPPIHTYSRGPRPPVTNSSIPGTVNTLLNTATGINATQTSTRDAVGSLPSHCDTWIGVEIIHMVEITENCPDGSSVTETITKVVETMTRSICETSTSNLPCYPCVIGTPSSSHDKATVTVTSCSTLIEPTVTVTVQLCSTCSRTTYTGTVPGYTPGSPCTSCSPYRPGTVGTTAVTPPLVTAGTGSFTKATLVPLISEPMVMSTLQRDPAPTTTVPPLLDQHPSLVPPEGQFSSLSGAQTPHGAPSNDPVSGAAPPPGVPLPPTKGHDDPAPSWGVPTTAAAPSPPTVVTAGTGRNRAGCREVLVGLLGLYLMYYMASA